MIQNFSQSKHKKIPDREEKKKNLARKKIKKRTKKNGTTTRHPQIITYKTQRVKLFLEF